jgi:uncharacterized protein (DUF58 family)
MALLDPAAVAAIEDLELAARLIVEGLHTGQHRSPFHGFSAEFSLYRQYRPGDDLKHLDWKMLARTDKLYTRQFRETTNMGVMLVVDTSASMSFPEPGVSKFRYAVVVAAALAHLVIHQGDSVGLMARDGERLVYLPAKGGRAHLRALLSTLEQLEPAGVWDPEHAVSRGAELLKRRGVMLVLSDFYDREDETRRALRRAARRGHDVGMLQIVSRPEIEFPYKDAAEFEDLETGARHLVAGASVAHDYRAAVGDFLNRCRAEAIRDGVTYALFPTDASPARVLRNYLLRR